MQLFLMTENNFCGYCTALKLFLHITIFQWMSVIASEVTEEVEKFNDANARKRYSFYEALNFGFYASFAKEIFCARV